MKAILCHRFGSPDDLVLADVPEPAAGAGEVVAKVAAVGLNFMDTLIIAGKYQAKPAFPFSPGAEFAGVVERVGAGVTAFAPGDRVMGYTNYGAARERVAVAADNISKLTADLDFERAAALTITYGTGYHALKHRARLQPGETLAVLGASGGAGLAAVELGKLMGARVIACASRQACLHARARRRRGGELRHRGSARRAQAAGRRARRRRGVRRGRRALQRAGIGASLLRSLAWEGRHLVVGFAAGEIPKLPLNLVLLKGCAVLGVFWGAWVRHDPAAYRAALDQLAHWCAEGKLSCHVDKVYPLAQTPQAIKALAERKAMGKLVVKP